MRRNIDALDRHAEGFELLPSDGTEVNAEPAVVATAEVIAVACPVHEVVELAADFIMLDRDARSYGTENMARLNTYPPTHRTNRVIKHALRVSVTKQQPAPPGVDRCDTPDVVRR